MQYLTLCANRESTHLALEEGHRSTERMFSETRQITCMTAMVTANEQWEEGLRADLAEFSTLTEKVNREYKAAKLAKQLRLWPGDKMGTSSGRSTSYTGG